MGKDYYSKKHDKDKVRLDLITPDFIIEVGKVLTFGANKYAPESWKQVPNLQDRYYAATLRHLLAYRNGIKVDSETGLSHLAHAACNIMFLMYAEDHNESGIDTCSENMGDA